MREALSQSPYHLLSLIVGTWMFVEVRALLNIASLIDLYTDMNVDDFTVKSVLFTIQSRFIWRVGFTASYDIVPMSDCLIETLYGALPQETDIVTPIFL